MTFLKRRDYKDGFCSNKANQRMNFSWLRWGLVNKSLSRGGENWSLSPAKQLRRRLIQKDNKRPIKAKKDRKLRPVATSPLVNICKARKWCRTKFRMFIGQELPSMAEAKQLLSPSSILWLKAKKPKIFRPKKTTISNNERWYFITNFSITYFIYFNQMAIRQPADKTIKKTGLSPSFNIFILIITSSPCRHPYPLNGHGQNLP